MQDLRRMQEMKDSRRPVIIQEDERFRRFVTIEKVEDKGVKKICDNSRKMQKIKD
jgi:hypothetical protein